MPDFITSLITQLRSLHGINRVDTIETHISWVLLTGELVYKIKKPVNLGFVDFTTLEKRRHFCFEELRLNKRLAPDLYIDVVALTNTDGGVQVNGQGDVIDYAVRLRQFDRHQQLDVLIGEHKLLFKHIDQLADIIAAFHQHVDHAPQNSEWGTPESVQEAVMENFRHCLRLATEHNDILRLEKLRQWSETHYRKLQPFLAQRKNDGYVRECHGDLHLGNIALFRDRVTPFDCIEFNPLFRWIDVISEIAFLVMDLISRGRQDMATRLLNDYLTLSGDYRGITGLRYYLVYRAMVRGKVEIIRASQAQAEYSQHSNPLSGFRHYIKLADAFHRLRRPTVIITHGMSGSGKTTLVKKLLTEIPAIHLRSDVERKRLFGLRPTDNSASALDQGIYSEAASQKTYQRLLEITRSLLGEHWPVIVDATFLDQKQRYRFQHIAEKNNAGFVILDCSADPASLQQRVVARARQKDTISEAGLSVLEKQLASYQPLSSTEQQHCLSVDTRMPTDIRALARAIRTG